MQYGIPSSETLPDIEVATRALAEARVLPVLRSPSAHDLAREVDLLASAGISAIEATTVTPGWDDALPTLRAAHPGVTFGVGTLTTAAGAQAAIAAGAAFLVSPWRVPDVRAVASAAGVLHIEGGFTPGEVAAAAAHGPAKVFPASIGGPAYLRSLRAVMPEARLIPTGGIRLEDVVDYLEAGAFVVGVGSALTATEDLAARLAAIVVPAR